MIIIVGFLLRYVSVVMLMSWNNSGRTVSEDNAPILDSNSELGAHLIFDLLTVFDQIEIENPFFSYMPVQYI